MQFLTTWHTLVTVFANSSCCNVVFFSSQQILLQLEISFFYSYEEKYEIANSRQKEVLKNSLTLILQLRNTSGSVFFQRACANMLQK